MFTSSHDFEVKSEHFQVRGLHFVIKLKIGKMFSNRAFKRPLTSTFFERRDLFKVQVGNKNLPIIHFLFDIA